MVFCWARIINNTFAIRGCDRMMGELIPAGLENNMVKHQEVNVGLRGAGWFSWQLERYRAGEGVCCGYLACLLHFIMPASALPLIKALWWMFLATGEYLVSGIAIGCLFFYQRLTPLAVEVQKPLRSNSGCHTSQACSFSGNYLQLRSVRVWKPTFFISYFCLFYFTLAFVICFIIKVENTDSFLLSFVGH